MKPVSLAFFALVFTAAFYKAISCQSIKSLQNFHFQKVIAKDVIRRVPVATIRTFSASLEVEHRRILKQMT